VDVRPPNVGNRCGVSSRLTSDCNRSASPIHDLRVLDQVRLVELALEELRRTADPPSGFLIRARDYANELAIRLLLHHSAALHAQS
jgi:hypothetical protein